MSQPEPPVRRLNITPLLRNHQANAPGGLWISIQRNDAPEQSKRLSLADLRTVRLYHMSPITGVRDERSDSNARPERELEQAANAASTMV
jgi:hypothetical protein